MTGIIGDIVADVADEVIDRVDPVKVHIVGTDLGENKAPEFASYRTIKFAGTEQMQQILPQNSNRNRAVLVFRQGVGNTTNAGVVRIGRREEVNNALGAELGPGNTITLEGSAAVYAQPDGTNGINISIIDELYNRPNQDN